MYFSRHMWKLVKIARIAKTAKIVNFGNSGDFGNLLRLGLVQHDVMPGLAFCGWIHGGKTDKIALAGPEFDRRFSYPGRNARKPRSALRVGVNSHVELVCSHESIRRFVIDAGCVYRLGVSTAHYEFNGARACLRVRDWDFFRLRGLSGLLRLRCE